MSSAGSPRRIVIFADLRDGTELEHAAIMIPGFLCRQGLSGEQIMDVRHHNASTGGKATQDSSDALGERGQHTQPTPGGSFSALFKHLAHKNASHAEAPTPSSPTESTESTPTAAAADQATMAAVVGVALTSNPAVLDSPVALSVGGSPDSAQNVQGSSVRGSEGIPFILKDVSLIQTHEAGIAGHDSAVIDGVLPTTTDLASHPAHGEMPALPLEQATSPTKEEESPIQNGPNASTDLAPISLKQPFGNPALLSMPPPGSVISDQLPTPVVANQETKNLPVAASVNEATHTLDRSSTGIHPPIIGLDQGGQETTPLGQSLSTMVIGERGRAQEESLGADGQGQEGETPFHSRTNRTSESPVRDSQSSLFVDQFVSAKQAQPSPQAGGPSIVSSTADHLKMAQAFLGEDHSTTMSPAPGMAQIVHLELPSHDSGPLSVRIAMTDQMVHTQFMTDRSDLGQFLLARQDQLQQDLSKSGLELGQFQVHIDHHGQQEGSPEWQSRQQGEARGDNRSPHQAEQQAQEKKGQHARSAQALSVFA